MRMCEHIYIYIYIYIYICNVLYIFEFTNMEGRVLLRKRDLDIITPSCNASFPYRGRRSVK